jgi:NADPH-dependent glutamate synthase beta subunit-like oxidoreductase
MYGIPNMKLDKAVVTRRIELMQASGVNFVLNTEIGTDISAQIKLLSVLIQFYIKTEQLNGS